MELTLLEDNPHWLNDRCYDSFTGREVLDKALSFLQVIKELLKTVNAKNIFFINLEKPEFIPYKNDAAYLEKIYEEYLKLANPNKDERIYFFIDEIQIFQNWEIFVKSKYENSNIKFIITGSNSSLLTSSYATVLTGRILKLRVHSFNFKEFLEYKNIDFSSR